MRGCAVISPEADEQLDDLIRKAVADSEGRRPDAADEAQPEPVPSHLRERVFDGARRITPALFALKILEAGEQVGWGLQELVEDVPDDDQLVVRELLEGEADPIALSPELFAHVLWRVEADPADWRDLLFQLVASNVRSSGSEAGEVWGRTSGLSGSKRGKALGSAGEQADLDRLERVASAFVAEVVEEWMSLMAGTSDE